MITVGYDAIRENISHLPPNAQYAGYTTGTDGTGGTLDIRWRNDDFNDRPGTIHICQDFTASDKEADVLDVESGAATIGDCPGWVRRATEARADQTRPGQRTPVIYTSASNVTSVANGLIAGGVKSGVGLWVADWSLTESQAIADVQSASGPFPIVGVQYSNGQFYDYNIWATDWLASGSGIAINPVHNLRSVDVGYTHITVAWDTDPNASNYTVKAFRGTATEPEREYVTHSADCRIRSLRPAQRYRITVRVHPGGSQGADATITEKTE